MSIKLNSSAKATSSDSILYVLSSLSQLNGITWPTGAKKYLKEKLNGDSRIAQINTYDRHIICYLSPSGKKTDKLSEKARRYGSNISDFCNKNKIESLYIDNYAKDNTYVLPLAEGISLANYEFLKYKTGKKVKSKSLKRLKFSASAASRKEVSELQHITDAVYNARTLVNEPVIHMTAVQLAKEFKRMGKESGLKVEVFNKKKIESLKMGGLLAVNYGSPIPPTFTIMEWKPKGAKNKKPIVMVGKGVVYDTGGLSLKPTAGSMDHMKCDMGGSAAVAGAIYLAAKNKLPLHVIALIPATDNRPGQNAYTPGDVIHMHNGMTVEVLNTDAEGRMIMADALSYAQKYKPELVMDAATLTGSSVMAIANQGVVIMGNADTKTMSKFKEAGSAVHERAAELPFWDDYSDLLKSEIADIKNVGGRKAGAITAGKFLQNFTDYPWIHVDIATMAWSYSKDSYRGKNGTGVGVRLFYEFLKRRSEA